MNDLRYVVISPVRNEEKYIEKTLTSMVYQTVRPRRWVIVDDGSSDRTSEIIRSYAESEPWIQLVGRQDRGYRKQGGGVVEAFYDGYKFLNGHKWDFIVKLDGDLSFKEDYFEKAFLRFRQDPKLGIGGGVVMNERDGYPTVESPNDPKFHVRGATKIYRKECWEDLGELLGAPGWDTLDEIKANMKGWRTYTFNDLPIIHHRPTGLADGKWKNWVKNGLANYISGYHPLFMFLKCAKRIRQYPYIISSLGLFWGYVSGYLFSISRVPDPELIKYIRQQQLRRLMFQSSIWR